MTFRLYLAIALQMLTWVAVLLAAIFLIVIGRGETVLGGVILVVVSLVRIYKLID